MRFIKVSDNYRMDLDSHISLLTMDKDRHTKIHEDFLKRKHKLSEEEKREAYLNQQELNEANRQLEIETHLNALYNKMFTEYLSLPEDSLKRTALRQEIQSLSYVIDNLTSYYQSEENAKNESKLERKLILKAVICVASLITSFNISIPATLITALGFILLFLNKDISEHQELLQRIYDASVIESYIDSLPELKDVSTKSMQNQSK